MECSTTPIDLVQFNTEAVVPFFASTKVTAFCGTIMHGQYWTHPAFHRYPSKMDEMKPRVFLLCQLWMATIYFTSTHAWLWVWYEPLLERPPCRQWSFCDTQTIQYWDELTNLPDSISGRAKNLVAKKSIRFFSNLPLRTCPYMQ